MPQSKLQGFLDSYFANKSSPAGGGGGLDNFLQQYFQSEVQAVKEKKEKPKKSIWRGLLDPIYTTSGAMYRKAGDVVDTLDWLQYQISPERIAGLPRPKTLGTDLAKLAHEQGQAAASQGYEPGTLPEKIYGAIGSAAVDVAALKGLGATGLGFAALPAYGAAEGGKEGGWLGAATGGAQGALMGGTLHGIAQLPSKMRFPTGFALGYTSTPGDAKDKLSSALTMGLMSMGGGKKTVEEFFRATPKPLTKTEISILDDVKKGLISQEEGFVRSIVERPDVIKLFQQKPGQVVKFLGEQFVDRLFPLRQFVTDVETFSGKQVAFMDNIYNLGRLFAGREGDVTQAFKELQGIFRPVRRLRADMEELGLINRLRERGGREIKNPDATRTKTDPRTGNRVVERTPINEAEVTKAGEDLQARLTPQEYRRISGAMDGFYAWADRWILRPMADSGVISRKAYKKIKADNNYWVPFEALKYADIEGGNVRVGSEFFSVKGQDIVKGMTGAHGKILPPFESVVTTLQKAIPLVEKNTMLNKLVGYRDLSPEIEKLIIPIKEGALYDQKGFEDLHIMRDGKATRWLVPRDLGQALKNLDVRSVDLFSRLVKKTSAAFRAGTTSYYLPFMATNAPRDFKMALLCSKYKFNPVTWFEGLYHGLRASFGIPTSLYSDYLRSHGAFGGLIHRSPRVTVNKLFEPKGVEIAKEAALFIKNISQAVELAPRMGSLLSARRGGASLMEAGLESRNVTIDFSRGGHLMRVMNQYVPFVNARLQAKVNLIERMADPKTRGAAMAKAMLWMVMPALSSYLYNTMYHPKVYDEIPDYVKDNYDVVVLGTKRDEQGREKPHFAKLVKGDFEQMVVNPTIRFMEYLRKRDPKMLNDIAVSWFSELSPIPFERNGKFSMSRLLSSAAPPVFRAPIEYATGKVLYTERDMVPRNLQQLRPEEQYTKDTPWLYKAMGTELGASPIKVQNLARGLGGAMLYSPSPKGWAQELAKRFVGTTGGVSQEKAYKLEETARSGYFSARKKIEDLLDQGKTSAAYAERAKWDKEFIGLLVQMSRLTGQTMGELFATPFYKMYSFQERDIKAIQRKKDDPWKSGLEKKLKYEFYKPRR